MRRPPRSTLDRSSAASDVYKRQALNRTLQALTDPTRREILRMLGKRDMIAGDIAAGFSPVSYTHLRAHETVLDLVCRLLLETKNTPEHTDKLCRAPNDQHTN